MATDDADDALDDSSLSVPRQTRGLAWVFLPVLFGLLLGTLFGAARPQVEGRPAREEDRLRLISETALVGGAVGLGAGLFVWVCFPYRGPQVPDPGPGPAETFEDEP